MIKNSIIILAVITLFSSEISTQMIINEVGIEEISQISFNPSFIQKKRVKSITTQTRQKQELRPIVEMPNLKSCYKFNDKGEISQYYKTYQVTNYVLDTIAEFYTYHNNQLAILIKSEYGRFGKYIYEYNNDRIASETRFRIENLSANKLIFLSGDQTKIAKQTYTYQYVNKNSYIRCTNSEEGICFKEEEVLLENNKKIKEKIRFIFDDSKQQSITYAYKKGKLISKLYKDEFNNKFQKKLKPQNMILMNNPYVNPLRSAIALCVPH